MATTTPQQRAAAYQTAALALHKLRELCPPGDEHIPKRIAANLLLLVVGQLHAAAIPVLRGVAEDEEEPPVTTASQVRSEVAAELARLARHADGEGRAVVSELAAALLDAWAAHSDIGTDLLTLIVAAPSASEAAI